MSIVDQTKRKQAPGPGEQPAKRVKTGAKVPCRAHTGEPVHHALLSRLYPNLCTLREYVLAKLPRSSRLRRKKIASVGLPDEKSEDARSCADIEAALGRLLDTTIVGFCDNPPAKPDNRWEQWVSFSQRGDESYVTLSDGSAGAFFSQREVRCAFRCSSVTASQSTTDARDRSSISSSGCSSQERGRLAAGRIICSVMVSGGMSTPELRARLPTWAGAFRACLLSMQTDRRKL